jgi:hypothetical protein
VTPIKLFAAALPALAILGFAPPVPVLSPVLCAAILLIAGELWLRALLRERISPAARLGLTGAAALATLPMIALTLHVLHVKIETHALAAALSVLAAALTAATFRAAPTHIAGEPPRIAGGPWRIVAAVAVPGVLAGLIGTAAVLTYQRLPHPAEPGFSSVALGGWAAGIAGPVAFPAGGLDVPIRVGGTEPGTEALVVKVGGRPVNTFPVRLTPGRTQAVSVHVPAPPDGCLHSIRISVGATSTIFYGRGPATC